MYNISQPLTMKFSTIKYLSLALTVVFLSSCMSTEEKKKVAEEEGNALVSIKSKLIKGAGDALKDDGKEAAESASEGIGEVIKGISTGFDKSLNQTKVVPDSVFQTLFEVGRTDLYFSDTSHTKKVTVYLISKGDFDGKVRLKAYDVANKEIGRSSCEVKVGADEAKYADFVFDQRTPLLQAAYYTIVKQ